MPSATAPPVIADDRLAELLELVRGADSVELELTVPEPDQRATMEALGMEPIDAQIRQVFFFDTPELTLDDAGVVVRARRVQGKGDDSVVKLRPVVPVDLSGKLRRLPGFGVEGDAMPGGFVCSGTLKDILGGGGAVKDGVAYLAQQGVDLSGEQETKTRRALGFFSARLKKQADDRHARNTGTRGQEETP